MGNSYGDPQQQNSNYDGNRDNSRAGYRGGRGPGGRAPGGRGPGGREGGGFRIRLSDNEMRAARSLQETFNLRSTVAVLGFAIRTLAQMLEEGKLDELIAQTRSQSTQVATRKEEVRQGGRRNTINREGQDANRGGSKPNPFARPEKPQPSRSENNQEEASPEEGTHEIQNNENELQTSTDEPFEVVEPKTNGNTNPSDEEKSNQNSES